MIRLVKYYQLLFIFLKRMLLYINQFFVYLLSKNNNFIGF